MTVVVSMGNDNINSTKTTQSVVRKLGLHRVLYAFSLHRVLYTIHSIILHRVLYSLILHRVLYALSPHRVFYTLRASLSGTLLQTLPALVTPLKGYSISAQLSSDAVSALRKVSVLI